MLAPHFTSLHTSTISNEASKLKRRTTACLVLLFSWVSVATSLVAFSTIHSSHTWRANPRNPRNPRVEDEVHWRATFPKQHLQRVRCWACRAMVLNIMLAPFLLTWRRKSSTNVCHTSESWRVRRLDAPKRHPQHPPQHVSVPPHGLAHRGVHKGVRVVH